MTEETMDDTFVELMQQDIDGVLSEEERARLRKRLERDPEARKMHEEFVKLASALEGIEEAEPPAGLRGSILNAVGAGRQDSPGSLRRIWEAMGGTHPVARYGYAFAAGLILGFAALYGVLQPAGGSAQLDPTSLFGTLAPPATVEKVELDLEHITGSVSLGHSEGSVIMELDLHAVQPVEVAVGFSPEEMGLAGFARSTGELHGMTAEDGRLRWAVEGEETYAFRFIEQGPAEAPLVLEIFAGGSRIHRELLRVPRGG